MVLAAAVCAAWVFLFLITLPIAIKDRDAAMAFAVPTLGALAVGLFACAVGVSYLVFVWVAR